LIVATGIVGKSTVDVPEGNYRVIVYPAGERISVLNVVVDQRKLTRIELKKEGSVVGVKYHAPVKVKKRRRRRVRR